MPEAASYEFGRYGRILGMIRAGKCDEEIIDSIPELLNGDQRDVLRLYRKIADGSISRGRVITSNATRTSDGRRTTVLALHMNGHGRAEIARITGLSERMVSFYIDGRSVRKEKSSGRYRERAR
jgi:hypothetical protein